MHCGPAGALVCLCAAFLLSPSVLSGQSRESDLSAARRLAAAGEWRKADEHLRRHRQAQPASEPALILHARALVHLGQPFDAVLEVEQYLQRHPRTGPVLRLYAALLVDVVRKPTQAYEVLEEAARVAPGDWQVWEALGKMNLGRNQGPEAVRCLERAARLAPANPRVASLLGRAYEETDRLAEAKAALGRALKLNAGRSPDPEVWRDYADFLVRQSKPKESLEFYTRALLANPHSADAYYGRALAHEALSQLPQAEVDALAATREDPGRRDVRQFLLRLYRRLGRTAQMEEQVQAIQRLAGQEQEQHAAAREMRAALNQAEALLRQGRFAEAVTRYEEAIRAVPTFYEAYFGLGIAAGQSGQTAKAEAALRKYLEFQQLSADGHEALGLLLAGAGRGAEARPAFEQALRLDPNLPESRKALARLTDDPRRALELLEPLLAAAEPETLEIHAATLLRCGAPCHPQLLAAWKARPRAPAYAKAITAVLIDRGTFDIATSEMVRILRRELPQDPTVRLLHARWCYDAGDAQTARDEAVSALSLPGLEPPLRLRVLTLAALAEEKLGRWEESEQRYREAHELNRRLQPPNVLAALNYAQLLLTLARYQDAAPLLAEILVWDPNHGPARLMQARLLSSTGKLEEAAAEAQRALEAAPDDPAHVRAAHVFLARTCHALGRAEQAKIHETWIRTH